MSQEDEDDIEIENEDEDEDEDEEDEVDDVENEEQDLDLDLEEDHTEEPVEYDEDISCSQEYKTKFSQEMRTEYIKQFHPEEIHKSFDEIYTLSHVIRDNHGMIIDENHKTYPLLSKYEKTRIIGVRVAQLNKGAQVYTKLKRDDILDNTLIAEKELQDKKLPFIIMRPIPNNNSEYWKIEDLELIY